MRCERCGYDDNGTGDFAHACKVNYSAPSQAAAMPEAVQNVIDCETCQGSGEIDETLGGEYFSNQHAKCPDCDGTGEITLTSPPAVQTAVPSERGEK